MYVMVCTRPDISHAIGVVSRFLANPCKAHCEVIKWIFRYLRDTSKVCLSFGGSESSLEGYIDYDMAGDLDCRKSTSRCLFTFAGGAISWQSKLQKCVSLSTTEVKYIVATKGVKEMLWMKRFLQELDLKQKDYIVHFDSQSALGLSKNTMYHARTKHIDMRYHWIKEAIEEQLFQIRKIHNDENTVDMMTKVIIKEKLARCIKNTSMSSY